MKYGICLTASLLLAAKSASAADPPAPRELAVQANVPVIAEIDGKTARLQINSGILDRLLLHASFVAASGIKPAPIMGKANVRLWGRKEITGYNRPIDYVIGGVKMKSRAMWFPDVPQPPLDGSIGPWAIPHERISIGISTATGAEKSYEFPWIGDLNNGSQTLYREATFGTVVSFFIERDMPYPLASAATGAAIAAHYGGTLSGEAWQETILFGITRPVRLLTLKRPFVIGPFAFTRIAVRVRSTIDRAGAGDTIAEGSDEEDADSQEIVVTAKTKGAKAPAFTFAIPRAPLNHCATMVFDKVRKSISLSCRGG